MTEKIKDRRGKPRISADLDARIDSGDEGFRASVKNISMSGLLLTSDQPVAEMTMVGLRLVIPAKGAETVSYAIEISGAVVRCEPIGTESPPQYEIAIFLTGMPRETRLALQDFIERRVEG